MPNRPWLWLEQRADVSSGPNRDAEALDWRPATTASIQLQPGEIHLWRVLHAHDARELARYERILSNDEQERAARFRAPRSREEFVQTRACLRLLLGHYSGLPPTSLLLSAGESGKPALIGAPCSFNVSHTEGVSMIAIATRAAVGVDVERVLPSLDLLAIAASHFSGNELSKLSTLDGTELTESFFRCWTRKEAFLKAQGLGLPHGLDAFEVTLLAEEQPAVLACAWMPDAPQRWSIVQFEPLPAIYGALASEQRAGEPAQHVMPLDWSFELAAQFLS